MNNPKWIVVIIVTCVLSACSSQNYTATGANGTVCKTHSSYSIFGGAHATSVCTDATGKIIATSGTD